MDKIEEKLKDLLGENLCLDFVNTVSWRGRADSKDFFDSYQDLLVWSRHVKIITNEDFKILQESASKNPTQAKQVMDRVTGLREALYAIFSVKAEKSALQKDDLSAFNNFLSKAMGHSRIIQTVGGLIWSTDGDKNSLDWMLNPIIRSAAELLVSSEIEKVKNCGDNECGWIFLDSSRNQSRRWCDMKDCGNRAKARRFYQKKKATQ